MRLLHHMMFHHRSRRRPKRSLTPKENLWSFVIWLMLCISGIVWLGIETQSAPTVIGAIFAILFVSFKILVDVGRH